MNPPSRTRHRRAPQRRRQASNQVAPIPRKRLLRNVSIQSNTDQSLTDPRIGLQPSPTAPSIPQASSSPARKRRFDEIVNPHDEKPIKRAKLTAKNLKQLGMGGRERKSTAKISGGSSTTTTTDKHFGTKLQQNGVIYRTWEARDADDIAKIRELLERSRASEPPDENAYKRYLRVTEDYDNELSVEYSAYPLISKRNEKTELSGYIPRLNHPWSALDNNLTKGLSDAQPDLAESYCATDYPRQAVEALSSSLTPSSYNESMPTYVVEFKSSSGDMKEAKVQCAYNGGLMTLSAEAVHEYMKKPGDDFYGKTQALTVATNGAEFDFYGHHAVRVAAKDTEDTEITTEYHQYRIMSDHPRDSLKCFKEAWKHVRNAQDFGYQLASDRKDALWAYSKLASVKTDVPITPPESSNSHLVSPQKAPQGKSRTRRKAVIDRASVVVDKPKVRRSAKTRKVDV